MTHPESPVGDGGGVSFPSVHDAERTSPTAEAGPAVEDHQSEARMKEFPTRYVDSYDEDHRRIAMAGCGHSWIVADRNNAPKVGDFIPCPICALKGARTSPTLGAFTFRPEWEQRVKERAEALGSDGCTLVNEWNQVCCWHHDIMWETGQDIDGNPVTKEEANLLFWECNRQRAWLRLSYLDPRSWARYVGVQIGAWWWAR